jgi:hypothetical protein
MKKNTTTNKLKTESLELKRKANEEVFNFWIDHPSLSITELCNQHKISPQKLRAWIKVNKKERPDAKRVGEKRKERQGWIAKGYERGLKKDLTATEVASWARGQCNFCIERVDIHSYANKFGLPLLKETVDITKLARETKYG